MREPKTHFQQIPVETVKRIATKLPTKEFPEDDAIEDDAASVEKQDEDVSPQERWREVAKKVQQEEDPGRMVGLVQELIATFDDEQLRKRLPGKRGTPKPSVDSGEDQS